MNWFLVSSQVNKPNSYAQYFLVKGIAKNAVFVNFVSVQILDKYQKINRCPLVEVFLKASDRQHSFHFCRFVSGKRISNSPLSKAIVKLSKVEARSTEENDEVIFSQRAKLFHLVDQEWKERGVGDAKVLRYAAKNLGKFVMRRDIVSCYQSFSQ